MKSGPARAAAMAGSLRNRPLRRLWMAQIAALTSVYGMTVAGAVLVESLTQSSAQTALVILSAIVPAFLGSLVAGAVVDRWGRVPVLLASHLARALLGLAFWRGTMALAPGSAVLAVYLVNAIGAMVTQFAMTSELSLLPDLVEDRQLLPANALMQLGALAAEGLGIIVLSPLIIKLAGVPAFGLAAAALCLGALALVYTLPKDRPVQAAAPGLGLVLRGLARDMRAGWQAIAGDRVLILIAVQATLAATVLLVLLSLLPGLAGRHLGIGVEDAPLVLLPGGVGFVVGAWLLSSWGSRFRRMGWVSGGLAALGVSVALLGVLTALQGGLLLVLLAVFLLGLSLALVVISARAILQVRPAAELRGRVIAAQLAMANAAAALPVLAGGALADRVGLATVMMLLGLVTVGAGVVGLRLLPGLGVLTRHP